MKSTLEFNLDDIDDRRAHLRAVKSLDLAICLNDIKEVIRRELKYEDLSEHDYAIYEKIQKKFYEILEEYNINLDEILL